MIEEQPMGSYDLDNMWRAFACWVQDRPPRGSGSPFLDSFLSDFRPADAPTLIQRARKQQPPLALDPQFGWLVGRPLLRSTQPVVPVATLQLDGDPASGLVTRCSVRAALFQAREDGTVHADGWRFELAESPDDKDQREPTHPYQHCQAIVGWSIDSTCLIHPTHSDGEYCLGIDSSDEPAINEERLRAGRLVHQSHPAFPLPSTTLTGLAAAVITTLYGAPRARAIFRRDARLERVGGPMAQDLDRILMAT
jgi:hypothetical protein